jgi:hypothetical protein
LAELPKARSTSGRRYITTGSFADALINAANCRKEQGGFEDAEALYNEAPSCDRTSPCLIQTRTFVPATCAIPLSSATLPAPGLHSTNADARNVIVRLEVELQNRRPAQLARPTLTIKEANRLSPGASSTSRPQWARKLRSGMEVR